MTVRKAELRFREFDRYRAFYCGLCHAIKEQGGTLSRMALSYEMTFLTILLSSLYDDEKTEARRRCAVHPVRGVSVIHGPETGYCARLSLMVSWYALRDGWEDERRVDRLAESAALKRAAQRAGASLPRQEVALSEYVQKLHILEKEQESNLDAAANLTGNMLSELFDWREDVYAKDLRELGFSLGKFIYLCDCYEDIERDGRKGSYNPLLPRSQDPEFSGQCERMLSSILSTGALAFERLPLIEDSEILRNILYSGIWQRFEMATHRRREARR